MAGVEDRVDREAVAVLYSRVEEVGVWVGGRWCGCGTGGWCRGGDEGGVGEGSRGLEEVGVSKGWRGERWRDGAGGKEGWVSKAGGYDLTLVCLLAQDISSNERGLILSRKDLVGTPLGLNSEFQGLLLQFRGLHQPLDCVA